MRGRCSTVPVLVDTTLRLYSSRACLGTCGPRDCDDRMHSVRNTEPLLLPRLLNVADIGALLHVLLRVLRAVAEPLAARHDTC